MTNVPFGSTECPSCGAHSVSFQESDHSFDYANGDDRVTLRARYPAGLCGDCGFEFTDERAEAARHAAICQHLGVLPPLDIIRIRRKLGLTREGFAELTKLGVASIARWERGTGIQNPALDQLLFLVSFDDNILRLKFRNAKDSVAVVENSSPTFCTENYEFPALRGRLNQIKQEAACFQLRPTGA